MTEETQLQELSRKIDTTNSLLRLIVVVVIAVGVVLAAMIMIFD